MFFIAIWSAALLCNTVQAAPSQQATDTVKAINYNANFDGLTAIPANVVPVGNYSGLVYNSVRTIFLDSITTAIHFQVEISKRRPC